MKSKVARFRLRHEILLNEMQLQSKLSKTIQDLLRQELSHLEKFVDKNEKFKEIEIHSKVAMTLEFQLRHTLSYMEESFNEMECLSLEILSLQEQKEWGKMPREEAELQEV